MDLLPLELFIYFSAETVFLRRNLRSTDSGFGRIKTYLRSTLQSCMEPRKLDVESHVRPTVCNTHPTLKQHSCNVSCICTTSFSAKNDTFSNFFQMFSLFNMFDGGLKETKMFLPHPRVKVSIVGSLRDREVACSASDRQGSNFESCVWRTVSSQSSHHPQEVLLAQFSLYVHKGGLQPDSFHFISFNMFASPVRASCVRQVQKCPPQDMSVKNTKINVRHKICPQKTQNDMSSTRYVRKKTQKHVSHTVGPRKTQNDMSATR